uniref:16S rRNA (guanine(966)-N(2))-methyltransferase RsmD n=1 Tax=Thaumasiovibrio occultus TaxID=1891184 RepID=UPI000B34DC0C|nr:16S rRNA (guanine(966)-N(2))-methyltransferase RsmD [Thaumasiovibrio occultus]
MSRRRSQTRRPNAQNSGGFVRIISGQWRGRKLAVTDGEGLRPTTDRVKETLFNWLAADIHSARCLDLFAGSGSLSFEALSRYASWVDMVELNPQAAKQLTTNLTSLQCDKGRVHHTDALQFLSAPATPYDVVFIDPPFRQGLLEQCLTLLTDKGWLSPNAAIYIETEKELGTPNVPEDWHLHREKIAGQVCYRLYLREQE